MGRNKKKGTAKNFEPQTLFTQCLQAGYSREKATGITNDYRAFFAQCKEYGHSVEEARNLANERLRRAPTNRGMDHIRLGRIIGLTYVDRLSKALHGCPYEELSESEKQTVAYSLGMDISKKTYIQVGCFRDNYNEVVCGPYLYGEERTDKKWLTKVVDGRNVASEGARWDDNRELLEDITKSDLELTDGIDGGGSVMSWEITAGENDRPRVDEDYSPEDM